MQKQAIQAVHAKDLMGLLKSLELDEALAAGDLKCFFCGCTLTLDLLQGIFPLENEIRFCCESSACFHQLMNLNRTPFRSDS